jgi:hypothetical protein
MFELRVDRLRRRADFAGVSLQGALEPCDVVCARAGDRRRYSEAADERHNEPRPYPNLHPALLT